MQLQELNTTDSDIFESEVQTRIDANIGPFSLFIVDMADISKLLMRSGQAASSRFLRTVAKSLLGVCREEDKLLKIGDSTFGIMMAGVKSLVHQQLAAEKILRLYREAIRDIDSPYRAEISIGIASYPEHARDAAELIHKTRIALEGASDSEEHYFVYAPGEVATMAMRWQLQEELGEAIENKQLQIHYQPKISAATGRPIGAEALLRWTSDKLGAVPPDVFIPVARDIGMLNDLTRYILATALQQAAEWPEIEGARNVSINLDAESIQDPDIVNIVSSSLSIFGTEQCQLTLEITETALVEDSNTNFSCLKKLRALGVGISIDDFGTGYSSLSYFKNIPATELKVDKSFVANMFKSSQDRNLVEAIIWIAHRFGLAVVAEGVEKVEQQELLAKLKCDVFQGFLYSRARNHDEFCRWLVLQDSPMKVNHK